MRYVSVVALTALFATSPVWAGAEGGCASKNKSQDMSAANSKHGTMAESLLGDNTVQAKRELPAGHPPVNELEATRSTTQSDNGVEI